MVPNVLDCDIIVNKFEIQLYYHVHFRFKLGLVLWYFNYCRLFNAKSFLYIYMKYIYDL